MKEEEVQLLKELSILNKRGVVISVEGREVTPPKAVEEFLINEEADYMRDYILDDRGMLIELGFYKL